MTKSTLTCSLSSFRNTRAHTRRAGARNRAQTGSSLFRTHTEYAVHCLLKTNIQIEDLKLANDIRTIQQSTKKKWSRGRRRREKKTFFKMKMNMNHIRGSLNTAAAIAIALYPFNFLCTRSKTNKVNQLNSRHESV